MAIQQLNLALITDLLRTALLEDTSVYSAMQLLRWAVPEILMYVVYTPASARSVRLTLESLMTINRGALE